MAADVNESVVVKDTQLRPHYWVASMQWSPPEKRKRTRAGKSSRSAGLKLSVTVTKKIRRQPDLRITGTGLVPARLRRHPFFSLALAFCRKCQNGYGVYRIDEDRLVLLAAVNGVPAIMGDAVGDTEALKSRLDIFLSVNEAPIDGWGVLSELSEPLDWSQLITQLSPKDLRACRILQSNKTASIVMLAGTLIILAGGGWYLTRPVEPTGPTAEELAARALYAQSKREAPKLPHPWASMADVQSLLSACQSIESDVPVAIGGWRLQGGICNQDSVTLAYVLEPGGTAETFRERSKAFFSVEPTFNFQGGAREASIQLPMPDLPHHDEAVPEAAEQLIRMLSWFQRKQVSPALNEIPAPEPSPPGAETDGEPVPVQDWREYQFSFSSLLSPVFIFHEMPDTGIRLTSVRFELNGSAFNYTTEGQIYASK
ncbi:type 4b pilus protein PilO2 [Salmonella enterica]|nr:type 4b pilus protein PilO2 [Salmonella enterica]